MTFLDAFGIKSTHRAIKENKNEDFSEFHCYSRNRQTAAAIRPPMMGATKNSQS